MKFFLVIFASLYTPWNVGGHHNDEALCSFNKMAAAATALFSSTEAAAAACAATKAVEFMWAAEAAIGRKNKCF